jgi:chemotaxis-related protein WspB
MLFLLFQLGKDRYALSASRVVEVAPLLELKRLPQAPKGIAGIFNYRGRPVPAVDLCEIATGQPASERLSTRIIIIKYQHEDGGAHLLGLIAENATEMLRKNARDFVDSGVTMKSAPYLGPVLMDSLGPIQWVDEQRLLSESVRSLLFANRPPAFLNASPGSESQNLPNFG